MYIYIYAHAYAFVPSNTLLPTLPQVRYADVQRLFSHVNNDARATHALMAHGEQYTPTHNRAFGRLDWRWDGGGRSAFFLTIIRKQRYDLCTYLRLASYRPLGSKDTVPRACEKQRVKVEQE